MNITPIELKGNWKAGWSMDYHTISSKLIDGHFETKRTDIGELVYQIKYAEDKTKIPQLAQIASDFLKTMLANTQIAAIIPVPPSFKIRSFQPVYEILKEMCNLINVKVDFDYLFKTGATIELKEIASYDARVEILREHLDLKDLRYETKNVLVFDDLYRSGATMKVISELLYDKGKVENVYVFTLTKTRVKK